MTGPLELVTLAGAQAATASVGPRAQAVSFWLFAAASVAGALLMVTRRNTVSAVVSLVATVLSLAVLFVMLSAGFLAVIQVIVYAGAILVLFVFVIMILNQDEDRPWALESGFTKALAGLGVVYLGWRLVDVLGDVPRKVPEPAAALAPDYGTTAAVGRELFTSYLFPFEAIALLLLIAVVGALVLARSTRQAASTPPLGTAPMLAGKPAAAPQASSLVDGGGAETGAGTEA